MPSPSPSPTDPPRASCWIWALLKPTRLRLRSEAAIPGEAVAEVARARAPSSALVAAAALPHWTAESEFWSDPAADGDGTANADPDAGHGAKPVPEILADREALLPRLREALSQGGVRWRLADGWDRFDFWLRPSILWNLGIATATEYHGSGRCLTRARLASRLTPLGGALALCAVSAASLAGALVGGIAGLKLAVIAGGTGLIGIEIARRAGVARAREILREAASKAGLRRVAG
ncbi:MAG: hypothetical protein R3F11_02345 [Verrucomicrobiales bacterium]